MTYRTISFDNRTDGGAAMRHSDRLHECCALLGNGGIAPDDLHKWADVMDLSLPVQVSPEPVHRQAVRG